MTRVAILGRNVKKENAFVKEVQQEMGNIAEVNIITESVTAGNLDRLKNIKTKNITKYIPSYTKCV